MRVQPLVRLAAAGLAAFLLSAMPTHAQQPSKTALSLANEILEIKGSMTIFEAVVPGVIEKSKSSFMQMSPNLFKDLNDVANDLRKEFAPRLDALRTDIAKIYALAFHRTGNEGHAHVLQVAARKEDPDRRAGFRRSLDVGGAGLGDQAER